MYCWRVVFRFLIVSFSFIPGMVLYFIFGTCLSLVSMIVVYSSSIALSISCFSLLLRFRTSESFSSFLESSHFHFYVKIWFLLVSGLGLTKLLLLWEGGHLWLLGLVAGVRYNRNFGLWILYLGWLNGFILWILWSWNP